MASNQEASYYVNVIANGQSNLSPVVTGINALNAEGRNVNVTLNQTVTGLRNSSRNFRRLSLDLRLVSIGIRTLRSELGVTNPAFEAMASSIQLTTAVVSILEGGFNLLARAEATKTQATKGSTAATLQNVAAEESQAAINTVLTALQGDLNLTKKEAAAASKALTLATLAETAATQGLMAAVTALAASFSYLLPVVAALAAIGIITWLNDVASGSSAARREVRRLTDANDELRVSMSSLRAEQSVLTAEQAEYQAQIERLRAEIEVFGERDDLVRKLNAVEAASRQAGVAAADYRVGLSALESQSAQTTAGIQAAELAVKKASFGYKLNRFGDENIGPILESAVMSDVAQSTILGAFTNIAGGQAGAELTKTGLIYAHAGEVVAPREQIPELAGGGGGFMLTISLAGANIYGAEGIRDALNDGANSAMKIIEQKSSRLNFLRGRN